MPLLDQNMLPKLVRTMEPMGDLLQAEQVVLDLLELYIQQLLADASVNNNRPLTKEVVEAIATALSHSPAHVDEFSDYLTIHIVINRNSGKMVDRETVIKKLEVLLPAHLRYQIVFQLLCGVEISYTCRCYRFSLDLCGGSDNQYCGEYPDQNMTGKIIDDGLLIGTGMTGAVFSSPLCGTTPYRNMAGKIADEEIQVKSIVEKFQAPYDMGQSPTGDYPWRSTAGATVQDGLQVEVAARGRPVAYPLTGTGPQRNMIGKAADQDVEIITTASSTIIKYPLTGTTPQHNMSGETGSASIVPQVAAEGYHFLVDYCQEDDYCGE